MQLEQLLNNKAPIERLRILSFEMNIYLVEIHQGEFSGLLRAQDGRPQRFNSVAQIKELFSESDVRSAELVHESPYDEMIGNPPRAANQMVLPLQFTQNKA
ncbi:DUF6482 family protein [Planctobacterium marinum]